MWVQQHWGTRPVREGTEQRSAHRRDEKGLLPRTHVLTRQFQQWPQGGGGGPNQPQIVYQKISLWYFNGADEDFSGSCGGRRVPDGRSGGALQEERGAQGSSDDGNHQPRVWLDLASGRTIFPLQIRISPSWPFQQWCLLISILTPRWYFIDHRVSAPLAGSRAWTESPCWPSWTCLIPLGYVPVFGLPSDAIISYSMKIWTQLNVHSWYHLIWVKSKLIERWWWWWSSSALPGFTRQWPHRRWIPEKCFKPGGHQRCLHWNHGRLADDAACYESGWTPHRSGVQRQKVLSDHLEHLDNVTLSSF